MKVNRFIILPLVLASFCLFGKAQDRGHRDGRIGQDNSQFTQRDQQAAHDWYNQHQAHPPAGFRSQDKLSSEEESRGHEGAVLDGNLRKRIHPAPADLARQLPPPPPRHRYVAVGNHVALIDNSYQVKAVIHLH